MKSPRKPYIYEAIVTLLFLILVMAIGIAVFKKEPHIPMLFGAAFAALMAVRLGYKWKDIEEGMINGIIQALQSVIILAIIGILIGVWVLSGVVPSMIYYGLKIISPHIFLLATVLICSITSLATGTSWGTVGTIGIALMGVAKGLNIPAPIAAGAIICGAYFGDKMSPLSDTTNLAPAMAGTDVFTHAKYMIGSNSITYIITLIFFLILGFRFGSDGVDLSSIDEIQNGLQVGFNISPILLLPPIVVIVLVAKKMPAIPGIFIGALLGMVFAYVFQGADFGDILTASMSGYVSNTGIETVDELLTAGGLEGMMYSISLTIIAMMFGGIMEKTGQLEVIVSALLKGIKSVGGLVSITSATCIISNITMPEQYISLVVPGRMYAKSYREKGLHPKTLSNVLESAGTLTSPLVPWNTCGAFMYSVLGVSATAYGKWAILNYLTPVVVILLAFLNSKLVIAKIDDDPDTVIQLAN